MKKRKMINSRTMSVTFKNKEELDLSTYDEIEKYRRFFLRNIRQEDWEINGKRYMEELDLYYQLRFKEKEISMYDEWRIKGELDTVSGAIKAIINRQPDNEIIYKFFTEWKIRLLQPMKYIAMHETTTDKSNRTEI